MPLFKQIDLGKNNVLAIWAIDEPIDFFRSSLDLSWDEQAELGRIKADLKKKQWLAARYLLHTLSPGKQRDSLFKDEHGKPHFSRFNHYISISHSGHYAAVIMHSKTCGIDIQLPTKRLPAILPRILSHPENKILETNRSMHWATFMWAAKEALYKAYGQKKLDFRENILLESIEFRQLEFQARGIIHKEDIRRVYDLSGLVSDAFVMVWALQL